MKNIKHLFLAVVSLMLLSSCGYNSMVSGRESVEEKWANVEAQYQRRANLIPNLVKVVKNYADFEQETLTKVIEARSKATSITIDPSNLTEANMEQFRQVQGEVSGALSRLLAVIERYPDLKANKNFLELQAQLEGTENRINVAHKDYNEAVKVYNTKIKKFPQMIYSGMLGFKEKPYFKAKAGAEDTPDVDDYFKD